MRLAEALHGCATRCQSGIEAGEKGAGDFIVHIPQVAHHRFGSGRAEAGGQSDRLIQRLALGGPALATARADKTIRAVLFRFCLTTKVIRSRTGIKSGVDKALSYLSTKESATLHHDPIITDRTNNQSAEAETVGGPVLLVNLFTPKTGKTDEFIAAQTGEYLRLRGMVKGWQGNRLGRAVDGSGQLVNIALFDSLENYNAWRNSQLFADHLEIIRPFVEKSAPGMYEMLYSAGDL